MARCLQWEPAFRSVGDHAELQHLYGGDVAGSLWHRMCMHIHHGGQRLHGRYSTLQSRHTTVAASNVEPKGIVFSTLCQPCELHQLPCPLATSSWLQVAAARLPAAAKSGGQGAWRQLHSAGKVMWQSPSALAWARSLIALLKALLQLAPHLAPPQCLPDCFDALALRSKV